MQPVAGQWLGVVIYRLAQGDALPHIPIETMDEAGHEAAEFLVDLATHDDSGELDSLIEELALDEVFSKNTRSAGFRFGQPAPLSFFVGVDDSAKRRADVGVLDNAAAQSLIEARPHRVVAMEAVDPSPRGVTDAVIEVLDHADILG